MKIIVLIENTVYDENRETAINKTGTPKRKLESEHGLSLYIETPAHRLLVDTGTSGKFIENAACLNVDLKTVDTLILSHGHYDHGGGIMAFHDLNPTVPVYIRENAFSPYYHKKQDHLKYIGLDPRIRLLPQVVTVDGNMRLDDELSLFTNVSGCYPRPRGNLSLVDDTGAPDSFLHEQYLFISSQGRRILVSGCAHNGIINIMEEAHHLYGAYPDMVLSGFHTARSNYTDADYEGIRKMGRELLHYPTMFYTGHCTGEEPYVILKEIMGDRLERLGTGRKIT